MQIQSQLRNMTASADNGTLVGALLSTGQYSGLSAVSLQSVDPVQPMNGPAAPSPGDLPRPSAPPSMHLLGFTILQVR